MERRRVNGITVALPDEKAAGPELSTLSHLDTSAGTVADFAYTAASIRDLDLTGIRLLSGHLSGIEAERVLMAQETQLHSVEIVDCTFGALRCEDSRLTRVIFRSCQLRGATFEECTFDNVLFEDCRLDYATFTKIRAAGPLAFTRCQLAEAEFSGCDFGGGTAIADCNLRQTDFRPGKYRNADLRGSDLTSVLGATNLTGAIISPDQEHQLAQALIAALDLTIRDTDS